MSLVAEANYPLSVLCDSAVGSLILDAKFCPELRVIYKCIFNKKTLCSLCIRG